MLTLMPNIEWVRQHCLSLAHTTEQVQWGSDLVFKVGGKMFAVMATEPAAVWLSFKSSPEEFAERVERPGVIPAPYLARAHWVALDKEGAIGRAEVRELLKRAHQLVFEGLSKRVRAGLANA